MLKKFIRQNFYLIAATLALVNGDIAKADTSPPYSQQGFINHLNTNPWGDNIFQYINPRAPMECYELKPLFGTWGGLTKGDDSVYFSEIKEKYVGLWGYGCFFNDYTTFTMGEKGDSNDWHLNICEVNKIYWNSSTKMYTYSFSRCKEEETPFYLNSNSFSKYLNRTYQGSDGGKSFNFDLSNCAAQPPSYLTQAIYYCNSGVVTTTLPTEKKRCEITSAFYTVDQSTNYSKSNCIEMLPFEAQPSALLNYLNKNIANSYRDMSIKFKEVSNCNIGESGGNLYSCTSGKASIDKLDGFFKCQIDFINWKGKITWSNCQSKLPFETNSTAFRNYLNGTKWDNGKKVFFHKLGDCSYIRGVRVYSCDRGNMVIESWRGVYRCDVEDAAYALHPDESRGSLRYSPGRCIQLDWIQQGKEKIERLGI